jgi:hypothetical protein
VQLVAQSRAQRRTPYSQLEQIAEIDAGLSY